MRFLTVYRRAGALLRADRRLAAVLVGANVLVAGLQFLDPILFGRVIGLLSSSDHMTHAALWSAAATLIGIWVGIGVCGIGFNMITALHAERMAHRNRLHAMSRYFAHVLSLPLSFHGDAHSGRLMKVMTGGSDSLFAIWLTAFREQIATYAAVVVLLPLTLLINWRLGIVLVSLVAVFVVITTFVVHKTQAGQVRAEGFQGQLAGTAQDALANVTVVQSFTRLNAEANRFSAIVDQVMRHQFPVLNWWAGVNVLTRGASTIAIITIVLTGTLLHLQGQASVAQIVSFMGFSTLLIGRLEAAVQFVNQLFMRAPLLGEFFTVLDAKSTVPEVVEPIELTVPHGEVAFEDVSFAYPGGPNILADMSFVARPGSVVALVGSTGAGKSTAMNLLQRMWDPVAGGVLIDGQDLRDVSLTSLRASIGVVFQESMLFNRSIRDNLLVGKPDATDAEIERACRMAEAHDFISRQPQGYDTMVGERGSTLSGGQRQRLAIARALLKNPPILILDEATSALDAATEAKVSRAMATLMQGRTTFVIAHRLSTVRDADEILVFDGGRIVERGTFDGLLERRGRFAELVSTQLAGREAPVD